MCFSSNDHVTMGNKLHCLQRAATCYLTILDLQGDPTRALLDYVGLPLEGTCWNMCVPLALATKTELVSGSRFETTIVISQPYTHKPDSIKTNSEDLAAAGVHTHLGP